ncbi:uncharacterized protein IWZ02DRAFT_459815 [Phyllosticta citriasiana]|uniref:uncharacterized protein n=1 Tax=Phyllosticta citriasiana TaxID=595635 RepID=UPI0030FD4554
MHIQSHPSKLHFYLTSSQKSSQLKAKFPICVYVYVCVCMYVCMYACAMQRQCQKEKRTKSQSVLLLASPSESGAGRTTQVASHFASHSLDSQPLQSPSRSPNLLLFTCGLSLLPLLGPILPPLLSSPHLSPRLPLLPLHLRICPSSQGTQGGSADRHFSCESTRPIIPLHEVRQLTGLSD